MTFFLLPVALLACTGDKSAVDSTGPGLDTADTGDTTASVDSGDSDTGGADTGDTAVDTADTDTGIDTGTADTETGDTAPPEPVTIEVVGDTSWKAIGRSQVDPPPSGWADPGFADGHWPAAKAPNAKHCGAYYTPVNPWERDSKPMWDAADSYAAFFRKVVNIADASRVTEAMITVFADDDISVWVNGTEIYREPDFGMTEDTGFDNTIVPTPVDLRAALVSGDNVIAINAQDTAGGCRWAIVSGSITSE